MKLCACRCLLQIHPSTERKYTKAVTKTKKGQEVQRKKEVFNPHVVYLLNKLADFEGLWTLSELKNDSIFSIKVIEQFVGYLCMLVGAGIYKGTMPLSAIVYSVSFAPFRWHIIIPVCSRI